jgi:hypothetical protein
MQPKYSAGEKSMLIKQCGDSERPFQGILCICIWEFSEVCLIAASGYAKHSQLRILFVTCSSIVVRLSCSNLVLTNNGAEAVVKQYSL